MIFYFKTMTLLGYGQAAIVFFVGFFVLSTREKAFYLLLVHTVAGIVNQELKMVYHNPRPYISSPDVQALGCSKSFGNPSGHSSLGACFYTTLFLIVFNDLEKFRHVKYENKKLYYLAMFCTLFLVINIGLSRVVLGVHALNQILYGGLYGFWVALFMFNYVRPSVYRHIKFLLEDAPKLLRSE